MHDAAQTSFDCLIVGAGHAGAQVATSLRQFGFEGSIGLIGAEPGFPYDRPSVSKDYLAGMKDAGRMLLRSPDYWERQDIQLLLGQTVDQVDLGNKSLSAGSWTYGFSHLIWATGGVARRLTCPGHDSPCVHHLRTTFDADRLRTAIQASAKAVVVGGGYLGLEAASVMRQAGLEVTVVEAADRLLKRVVASPVSAFFAKTHRSHGVDICLGVGVDRIEEGRKGNAIVALDDGRALETDLVLVAIGMDPVVAPLETCGVATPQGVPVDDHCRSSVDTVYAVGDCAYWRDSDGHRIEAVQNAIDQATIAAKVLCGQPVPELKPTRFWSNQFDVKLQTAGLNHGYDETVLRGDPSCGRFSLIYLRAGQLIAIDCINTPKDFVQGARLVAARATFGKASLADSAQPLRDLVHI